MQPNNLLVFHTLSMLYSKKIISEQVSQCIHYNQLNSVKKHVMNITISTPILCSTYPSNKRPGCKTTLFHQILSHTLSWSISTSLGQKHKKPFRFPPVNQFKPLMKSCKTLDTNPFHKFAHGPLSTTTTHWIRLAVHSPSLEYLMLGVKGGRIISVWICCL